MRIPLVDLVERAKILLEGTLHLEKGGIPILRRARVE